ncbi:hypothetical protein JL720_5034 [Aureococcus anophagefferens]|nr:hypothetical protein JL720_5034 [Aureococcus anophagefferens]
MFAGEDEWRYVGTYQIGGAARDDPEAGWRWTSQACEDSGNDFTAWRGGEPQDYGICKIEQCAAIGYEGDDKLGCLCERYDGSETSDYFRANKGKIESEHCTAGDIVLIIFFCMLPFICCCCIMTQTAPAPPQAYAQPAPQYQQPIQQGQIVGQPYQQPIQQGQIVGQAYQQPIQQGRVVGPAYQPQAAVVTGAVVGGGAAPSYGVVPGQVVPGQVVEGSVVQGTYNPVQPGYAPVENPHEPGAKVF